VTYKPAIQLYNPHDEVLHVTEIFTSGGGFLHLDLPADQPAGLWSIEPRTRKDIINLAFMSEQPGKYTGFVNIKTDKDNMILHVEVTVVKGGLHRTPEEIDFSTLTSPNEKLSVSILLLNSGEDPILVSEIYPLTPDLQLFVNFSRLIIPPDSELEVATFTYSGRTEGEFSGKLLLRSNDSDPSNSRMEIPYKARVLHGSLGYLPLNTTFSVGTPPFKPIIQSLVFTNKFSVPLVFYSAEIEDPHFEVLDFSPGATVMPGDSWPPVYIKFLANSSDMMYRTELALATNVSVLRVALHCYHGHLSYEIIDEDKKSEIDFGVVGVSEIRTRMLNVSNGNPVKVAIHYIETELEGLSIKLDSLWNSHGYATSSRGDYITNRGADPSSPKANWNSRNNPHNTRGQSPLIVLEPGHSALFTVELSSTKEEKCSGSIRVHTAQEYLVIPVKYHSMKGTLTISPPVIRFDEPSFPGKVLWKSIMAKSTFSRTIHLESIISSDGRLIPILSTRTLEPNKRTEIGRVLFDPSKGAVEDNYLAEPSLAAQAGLSRSKEPLTKRDVLAHKRRDLVWNRLLTNQIVDIRGSLTINADVVMGYTLAVRASLMKPSIVDQDGPIDFQKTQVGSSVSWWIPIHNPSDHTIHVRLLPFEEAAKIQEYAELLPTVPPSEFSSSFYLPDDVSAKEGEIVPPHSKTMLGPVFFAPCSLEPVTTTLYVKNNLTIIDSVVLTGEGGSGYLLFEEGDKEIDSLLFDVNTEHLLKFCTHTIVEAEKGIVVSKTFKAINKGNLPVNIESVSINGRKCGGYGFDVENCKPFSLGPSESAYFRVSFTPDFSSSVVDRELMIHTTYAVYSFSLIATIPHHLLPLCVDSQPKTKAEETLQNTTKAFMVAIFVILCIITIKEFYPFTLTNNHHFHTNESSSLPNATSKYTNTNNSSSKYEKKKGLKKSGNFYLSGCSTKNVKTNTKNGVNDINSSKLLSKMDIPHVLEIAIRHSPKQKENFYKYKQKIQTKSKSQQHPSSSSSSASSSAEHSPRSSTATFAKNSKAKGQVQKTNTERRSKSPRKTKVNKKTVVSTSGGSHSNSTITSNSSNVSHNVTNNNTSGNKVSNTNKTGSSTGNTSANNSKSNTNSNSKDNKKSSKNNRNNNKVESPESDDSLSDFVFLFDNPNPNPNPNTNTNTSSHSTTSKTASNNYNYTTNNTGRPRTVSGPNTLGNKSFTKNSGNAYNNSSTKSKSSSNISSNNVSVSSNQGFTLAPIMEEDSHTVGVQVSHGVGVRDSPSSSSRNLSGPVSSYSSVSHSDSAKQTSPTQSQGGMSPKNRMSSSLPDLFPKSYDYRHTSCPNMASEMSERVSGIGGMNTEGDTILDNHSKNSKLAGVIGDMSTDPDANNTVTSSNKPPFKYHHPTPSHNSLVDIPPSGSKSMPIAVRPTHRPHSQPRQPQHQHQPQHQYTKRARSTSPIWERMAGMNLQESTFFSADPNTLFANPWQTKAQQQQQKQHQQQQQQQQTRSLFSHQPTLPSPPASLTGTSPTEYNMGYSTSPPAYYSGGDNGLQSYFSSFSPPNTPPRVTHSAPPSVSPSNSYDLFSSSSNSSHPLGFPSHFSLSQSQSLFSNLYPVNRSSHNPHDPPSPPKTN